MQIEWVPTNSLVPNPNNRNKHPKEQIERLAKIIKANGWRHPIIVSKLSGQVVVGHGRLEAAKLLNEPKVPVHFQDFANETEEYQFGIADNAIASWAELDLSGINADLPELGPELDVDLLGIKNFTLEPMDLNFIENEEELLKYPFRIVCSNEAEQAYLKSFFDTQGEKITYQKFIEVYKSKNSSFFDKK